MTTDTMPTGIDIDTAVGAGLNAVTSWAGDKDGWNSDAFEDHIARTVIGLYEPASMVNPVHPAKVTQDEINRLRASGAYVSHPTRVVFTDSLDSPIDNIYAGAFCHSLNSVESDDSKAETYQRYFALKRAPSLPKPYYKVGPGSLYALLVMEARTDGRLLIGKSFFTCSGRAIVPCDFAQGRVRQWERSTTNPFTGETLSRGLVKDATATANFLADAKNTWTITAQEGAVRVGMGAYHEEVKSLLYARSLPMTATGRKRPILHLVSAHRRRLREGVDINIDPFLRGVRKVEMGGAVFEVSEPAVAIRAEVGS